MNATQRKALAKLIDTAQSLHSQLDDVAREMREIADQEQEKVDNMPESLQSSPRGESMQEDLDNLTNGCDEIEGALYSILESLSSFIEVARI